MKITINPLPYKYEMKKILSIVLTLAMLLSLSAAAFAEETKAPVISAKDMSFYLNDLDDVKTYPVYFMGDSDVPYFSLADWAELLIAAVPSTYTLDVCAAVKDRLRPGQVYADVSASTARVKEAVWEAVMDTGVLFADAAMLGPLPTYGHISAFHMGL